MLIYLDDILHVAEDPYKDLKEYARYSQLGIVKKTLTKLSQLLSSKIKLCSTL